MECNSQKSTFELIPFHLSLAVPAINYFLSILLRYTNRLWKVLIIPVVSAGPKGVIHDWRKFKLESEDHESTPQKRRELLRQMSNPKANTDDNNEKINRKVITQYHKSTKDFTTIMTQWSILGVQLDNQVEAMFLENCYIVLPLN